MVGLIPTGLFIWYVKSGYQEKKIIRHTKWQQTQLGETEQTPEADMAELLELSEWGFKTTMINMLKALMDKEDLMRERKMLRTKKKCYTYAHRHVHRNARDQNH